jgi:hypothetical protein
MNDVSAPAHADDFSLANTHELEDGLNDDLRARVKNELEPGERLLWAGRCDPPFESHGAGYYVVCMITLCLLGLGFFLIMPSRVIRHWNDGSAGVMGIGFLVIAGLSVLSLIANWNGSRVERRRLRNTCYAVTDRRAIVWTPESKCDAIRIQALGRPLVKNLMRVERPDGSGHLEFSGVPEDLEFGYYHRFRFAHIPEVRRVEQIVRKSLMTNDPIA